MQPHWTLTILRGEFVYTVRAVGAGLGPRGVELAGAAAPGFRASSGAALAKVGMLG